MPFSQTQRATADIYLHPKATAPRYFIQPFPCTILHLPVCRTEALPTLIRAGHPSVESSALLMYGVGHAIQAGVNQEIFTARDMPSRLNRIDMWASLILLSAKDCWRQKMHCRV